MNVVERELKVKCQTRTIARLGVISAKDGVGSRVIHRIAPRVVPVIRGIAPRVGLVGRGGVGGHHQETSS